jgi:hypothetical protein
MAGRANEGVRAGIAADFHRWAINNNSLQRTTNLLRWQQVGSVQFRVTLRAIERLGPKACTTE